MTWKDFLNKCSEAYSIGEVYVTSFDDVETIKRETGIQLKELSPVSDRIYDEVYYQCKKLYPTDPMFNQLTSFNTGYGQDVDLPIKAGSLEECHLGDLEKWVNSNSIYTISEKLDGCSIILYYSKGHLQQAITRGDGYKGKDVTRHIVDLPCIPLELKDDKTFTGYIRGELICPIYDIQSMLSELNRETGRTYKNGRNTIAGYLNSKETLEAVKRYAQVVTYNIMGSLNKHSEQLSWLNNNGFLIVSYETIKGEDINDKDMIDKVNQYRRLSRYEIDGIVITRETNEKVSYETGTINPTNARKFKMINASGISNVSKKTTVTDIIWNPSKNGLLKPILNVEPIELDGVTVSNVTGNNYAWLKEREIGIGSEVEIIRAGSVIPKIIKVFTPSVTLNIPTGCHQEGVDLVLDNKDIDEVTIQKLVHLAQTLNLDQAGQASMEKLLHDYPELKDPVNIFNLTLGSFRLVLGVNGVKLFQSLKKACESMTESRLADACSSFGPGMGESLLAQIEEAYGSLIQLTSEINNFGPARLKQYQDNYDNWIKTKESFVNNGGTFIHCGTKTAFNKIVTPTGFRFKADEVERLEAAGYGVSDSFNKSTSILVVKDINSTSSKTEKAKKMGINIMSYNDFIQSI